MKIGNRNRIRRGSVSIAVTALVLAAVILVNVGFGLLCSGQLWYLDLTSEKMYTLTEETRNMLTVTFRTLDEKRQETGEKPAEVEIIFCSDPDVLTKNLSMKYVYYTALELQDAFPGRIKVSSCDVWANPSAVDAYRTNSYSTIYQSNVIVASGSEYRVLTARTFYTYDDEVASNEPWAYNGEKKFVSAILAVTRAEAPICAVTVNHGEPFGEGHLDADGKETYSALLATVESAGYDVMFLDLEKDPVPDNCRLILTFDPQTDFTSGGFLSGETDSEIKKLDKHLENAYSYLVFVDADTPYLPNLEEFLADWGISFNRYANPEDTTEKLGNYQVVSPKNSLDTAGLAVIADYETEAIGGSITDDMRSYGLAPKVIFRNAMPISYSASYKQSYALEDVENEIGPYAYGLYEKNYHFRYIYDVFRSSAAPDSYARAVSNGTPLTDASDNPIVTSTGSYKLMTITRENRTVGEGKGYSSVNEASYVCAIGSTEFAGNQLLGTNTYGNTDVLLQTLRTIGREVVPVGLIFKPLYDSEMAFENTTQGLTYCTPSGNATTAAVLILIPVVLFSCVGVTVLVRRKNRH